MKKEPQETQYTDEEMIFEETDAEGSEASGYAAKITKLKDQLKTCKEERQEYLDGWQRSRAEFVNTGTAHTQALSRSKEYAQDGILNSLLPILDSFDMAMKNKEVWESVDKNWRTGVEYIRQQLLQTLQDYDVSIIDALHTEFDPALHEPLETVDVTDAEQDNQVIEIIQNGYQRKEKILRAVKVKVGKLNKE